MIEKNEPDTLEEILQTQLLQLKKSISTTAILQIRLKRQTS